MNNTAMKHETLPEFKAYPDREALAEQLAENVARCLREAIQQRGKASLVVSGGSTPASFFKALKQEPLAWERIYITLADERWVSADSDESTEKLVREQLLTEKANFIPLKNEAPTAKAGQPGIEETIAAMPLPFDVVILGMGEDGHTASLFPNHPTLEEALHPHHERMTMAIENAPKLPPERITLTFPALTKARHVILHITGEGKREVYEKALTGTEVNEYPIRALLHQNNVPVTVYWTS